ncbi:MAG: hypothetical protein ABIC91_07660 [Nanoarchaeota archaeon]
MQFFKDGYDLNDKAKGVRIFPNIDDAKLSYCRLAVIANRGFVWIDMSKKQLSELKTSIEQFQQRKIKEDIEGGIKSKMNS